MHIFSRVLSFLDIAKLAIYGIFLNYYFINILRGSLLSNGTLIFYAISIACVFVSVIKETLRLSLEIKLWIAYAILSLLTAIFAVNSSVALTGIGDYVTRLILIIMIVYICEQEQSVGFAIRLLAVTAISCSISSLVMSESVSVKLTMISGAHVSTNDIGALMAFGCFAVLFSFGLGEKKGFIKTLIKISYIVAAVSVIFLAGSRKSLLAIMILFAILLILCGRDYFRTLSAGGIVVTTIILISAMVFVYIYLLPHVESTDMYQSLYGAKAESKADSDETRIKFYAMAWQHFIDSPIVGLGYNNFAVRHGNYTHSTYVEPLACSGIIGVLYLAPYVMILVKQIKLIKLNKGNTKEVLWQKELLAFYISFLFVGIGIPYIYKDIPCIVLALFIASQKISFDKLNEEATVVAEGVNRDFGPNQSITSTI